MVRSWGKNKTIFKVMVPIQFVWAIPKHDILCILYQVVTFLQWPIDGVETFPNSVPVGPIGPFACHAVHLDRLLGRDPLWDEPEPSGHLSQDPGRAQGNPSESFYPWFVATPVQQYHSLGRADRLFVPLLREGRLKGSVGGRTAIGPDHLVDRQALLSYRGQRAHLCSGQFYFLQGHCCQILSIGGIVPDRCVHLRQYDMVYFPHQGRYFLGRTFGRIYGWPVPCPGHQGGASTG